MSTTTRVALAWLIGATLVAGCGGTGEGEGAAPEDHGADAADTAEAAGDAAPEVATWAPEVVWEAPVNAARELAPEPPAILRDVSLVTDDIEFTRPYVPGHRTTMDGRVAIRVQGGPPGTERIRRNFSFFLLVPEALDEPVMPGPAGVQMLPDPEPWDVPFPPAQDPEVVRFGHHALCDATEEFPVAGERPNPYACGPDDTHDCYDLTIISSTATGATAQLWGTPVTVEVADPKTRAARLERVELGVPVAGMQVVATNELLEPAVTRDGRLLTARLGRAPRHWTNPRTGEEKIRYYDLVYFPPTDGADPCDVTAWTEFQPMSHAPYDPRMVGRYGLAAQPFRDSEGGLIEEGEDLGGTYPWVDREGANVFMTAVPGRMIEQSEAQFPRRCVHEGCEGFGETIDWDRGFLVAGLWTHGKFVHLDAMINHLDWAVGITPEAHYLVDLYRTPEGDPFAVRLGAGRFIDFVRDRGGPYPPGYTHNANILDSIQNLPNHQPHALPVTPRDVVWIMSNGIATDEVAFDDFLDPHAFIVSNMQASITQFTDEDGGTLSVPIYWNGQRRKLRFPYPFPQMNELKVDEVVEVHLQNAATSPGWAVPAYGLVAAGEGRVEPAALGGVKGKGFWLSGATQITYAVPPQARDVRAVDWSFGIFVDPRGGDDERRVLLEFPDGSLVELEGGSTLRYVARGGLVHEVRLPPPAHDAAWRHLGWRVTDGGRRVALLVDGFPFDALDAPLPLFAMVEGDFIVGRGGADQAGFRGWIDDLKVLAHDVNAEVACNHAHGTLIRVDDNPLWGAVADRFPAWAHDAVAAEAGEAPGARFACFHDYRKDYGAHLQNIPDGTVGIREAINFPEGPLRAGAPRPDSVTNPFCLSCHHGDGEGGLGLDALTYDADVLLEHDRRRQPLQPPRRVFGHIPAGWLPHGPAEALTAPPEGVLVDPLLLPPAE